MQTISFREGTFQQIEEISSHISHSSLQHKTVGIGWDLDFGFQFLELENYTILWQCSDGFHVHQQVGSSQEIWNFLIKMPNSSIDVSVDRDPNVLRKAYESMYMNQ